MVTQTQTQTQTQTLTHTHTLKHRRQQPPNYLNKFDHFVGLVLKGLIWNRSVAGSNPSGWQAGLIYLTSPGDLPWLELRIKRYDLNLDTWGYPSTVMRSTLWGSQVANMKKSGICFLFHFSFKVLLKLSVF